MNDRIKQLEDLLEDFYELGRTKTTMVPTNPFEEKLLIISDQMDIANIEIVKIIKAEIKAEKLKYIDYENNN
jgi:hypothetical protein